MEKKPKIDGKWVEVDAKELVSRKEEVESSEILVVNAMRVEFGGSDKEAFAKRVSELCEELSEEMEGMDDEQRSFYVIKKMLVG